MELFAPGKGAGPPPFRVDGEGWARRPGQTPVSLMGASGAAVELLSLALCRTGILVEGMRDVALNASRVWVSRNALVVRGSENVVVGAFRSDNSLVASPAPHVLVEGSEGVFFTGTRIVKPSSSTYDVDVSLAGSRVLFGPHNIIAARINSGGNFAALRPALPLFQAGDHEQTSR